MRLIASLSAVATTTYAKMLTALPLSTQGSKIVDTNGETVRLACVNWYGAHMQRFTVDGLDKQNLDSMSQNIAD